MSDLFSPGLHLLLGPAGSGKTTRLLEEIANRLVDAPDGPPILLVVPEQATAGTERALLRSLARRRGRPSLSHPAAAGPDRDSTALPVFPVAVTRAQVLSFRRLAWTVLQEVGGAALPVIGPLGKRMILRRILDDLGGTLGFYGPAAGRTGFLDAVSRAITEFHTYRVDPPALHDAAARIEAGSPGSPLARKLLDLHRIHDRFTREIEDHRLDPDGTLALAAERIGSSQLLSRAAIVLDGFVSFTPQEWNVIERVHEKRLAVVIALTSDHTTSFGPLGDPFEPTRKTLERLGKIERRHPSGVVTRTWLHARNRADEGEASAALGALERFLVGAAVGDPTREEGHDAPDRAVEASDPTSAAIVFASTRSPRDEVEYVAREITALTRASADSNAGPRLRYRDIALVAVDPRRHAPLLDSVFRAHDIPLFMDLPAEANLHPVVRYVESAIAVASGLDLETPLLFDHFRARLAVAPEAKPDEPELDALENHVLAVGIDGAAWLAPWRKTPRSWRGPEREAEHAARRAGFERIRDEALAPLLPFLEAFHAPGPDLEIPVARFAAAIRALVAPLADETAAVAAVDAWSRRERDEACTGSDETVGAGTHGVESQGVGTRGIESARIFEAFAKSILRLVDDLETGLGPVTLRPRSELCRIASEALDALAPARPPATLDAVSVMRLEHSRGTPLRALFVLDVNASDFPGTAVPDALLSDEDRNRLEEDAGLELGPTAIARISHLPHHVYRTLSLPRERLTLVTTATNERGRTKRPAPLLEQIERAFGAIPALARQIVRCATPGTEDPLVFLGGSGTVAALAARTGLVAREGRACDLAPVDRFLDRQGAGIVRRIRETHAHRPRVADPEERRLPPDLVSALIFRGRSPETIGLSVTKLERHAACPFAAFAGNFLRLEPRETPDLGVREMGEFVHAVLEGFERTLAASEHTLGDIDRDEAGRILEGEIDRLVSESRFRTLADDERMAARLAGYRRRLSRAVDLLHASAHGSDFRCATVEAPFGAPGAIDKIPFSIEVAPGRRVPIEGKIDRVEVATVGARTLIRVIDYKTGRKRFDLARAAAGLDLQLPTYLLAASSTGAEDPASGEPAGLFYLPLGESFDDLVPGEGEAWAAERREKRLRFSGLLVADFTVARAMNRALGEEGRRTRLVDVKILKDGDGFAKSPLVAIPEEAWRGWLSATRDRLARLFRSIESGDIGARPFRLSNAIACTACDHAAVCRFESAVDTDGFRDLPGLPGTADAKIAALGRVATAAAGAAGEARA